MKFLKKEKSTNNLIIGIIYQIVSIAFGLLLPYLFITELGSETNGLINSVGQVFTCLSLLEAGIAVTTIQALYKPLAVENRESINAILSATHAYYKRIAVLYTVALALLMVVYPYCIDTKIDHLTIRLVIFFQGAGSILGYLLQSKYTMLLKAEGKYYILHILSLLALVLRNFGKIWAIKKGYGIDAVQAVHFLTIVIEAIIILVYMRRKYKWLNVKTAPDFQAISQRNQVFIQSLSWMIFNHTDIIVLTLFSRNLALVSVYSVYTLFFEVGQNVIDTIRTSYQYKLGLIYQDGQTKFDSYFKKYSTIIITVNFVVFTVLYLTAKPFVSIYTKGIQDIDYIIVGVPELFLAYKLIYGIRMMNRQIIDVNGDYKRTSYIAIIEMIINLSVSVVLVIKYGILGVLIGTVVALIFSNIAYWYHLGKYAVPKSINKEIIIIGIYMIPFVLLLWAGKNLTLFPVNSWFTLCAYACIVGIASVFVYGVLLITNVWLTSRKK